MRFEGGQLENQSVFKNSETVKIKFNMITNVKLQMKIITENGKHHFYYLNTVS